MPFINDDFMLKNETAKKLYSAVKDLPIIDYHCHLSPKLIAENYMFKNATDLFLGGDHYKWRQMRTAGVDEEYITGNAPDYEKFRAFARVMPRLIGNPIYHWTHLELARYFGIYETLSEATCDSVWQRCNELLSREDYRAKELIKRSGVVALCTTDDPIDTLEYHKALSDFEVKVLPTLRPDKLINIDKETFLPYIDEAKITSFDEIERFIVDRVAYFASVGCRLSDHALDGVSFALGDARAVFEKKLSGAELTENDIAVYKTEILTMLCREYTKHGFVVQIHIGALRNNNPTMYKKLGADTGFDSINDREIAEPLSKLLGHLELSGILPKTILYNLNPKDNYTLATMIGNFQGGGIVGKMQFGSGWWFLDQRDGMEAQMRSLANLGMLSAFVGMLTDSRSFVSYTRHEYFRRILCNLIGGWVEDGEYPNDMETLETIVKDVCFYNAKRYFSLDV